MFTSVMPDIEAAGRLLKRLGYPIYLKYLAIKDRTDMNLRAPVFIVGAGRSGTTILGKCFSILPYVCYLYEERELWSTIDPCTYIQRYMDGKPLDLALPPVQSQQQHRMERIWHSITAYHNRSLIVEKNPDNSFRLEWLHSLNPLSQIVWIIRDGREVAQSVVRHSLKSGTYRLSPFRACHPWWGEGEIKWKSIVHSCQKHDIYCGLVNLDELTEFEKALIEWLFATERCLHFRNAHPDTVVAIRYEEFITQPDKTWPALMDSLGFERNENVEKYVRHNVRKQTEYTEFPECREMILAAYQKMCCRLDEVVTVG
ncbi:MAG: sulfotransferase [Pirellulales bacterium]|nr:sulfotransferase [Pirellulales bacterium]